MAPRPSAKQPLRGDAVGALPIAVLRAARLIPRGPPGGSRPRRASGSRGSQRRVRGVAAVGLLVAVPCAAIGASPQGRVVDPQADAVVAVIVRKDDADPASTGLRANFVAPLVINVGERIGMQKVINRLGCEITLRAQG